MKHLTKYLIIVLCSILTLQSGTTQNLWQAPKQNYKELWGDIKANKPIKVMHIGDSHINRGYTTRPIELALHRKYGQQIVVTHNGINGSTYTTWTSDNNLSLIQTQAPDLLIVSLGTNDSYTYNFSAETLRAAMKLFLDKLAKILPNTKVVLTTPPACYLKKSKSRLVGYKRGRKGKKTPIYSSSVDYSFNNNTRIAVNTMKYFAKSEGLALIDLNAQIGSKPQCEEWLKKGLMHTDHVHYTEPGYAKHGELIAQTLIEAIESK